MLQVMLFSWQILVLHIAFLIFPVGSCLAQTQIEMYQTRNGIVEINIPIGDSVLTAQSGNLEVLLNYNTAEIEMRLPLNKIHTGIDSIDTRLLQEEGQAITLSAKLGLDYINTQNHLPLLFYFDGVMDTGLEQIQVTGEGHLVHLIGGEAIDCRLGMEFTLNPHQFNWPLISLINDPDAVLKVTIVQSVLEKLK